MAIYLIDTFDLPLAECTLTHSPFNHTLNLVHSWHVALTLSI